MSPGRSYPTDVNDAQWAVVQSLPETSRLIARTFPHQWYASHRLSCA
jgi:hypothetical protein